MFLTAGVGFLMSFTDWQKTLGCRQTWLCSSPELLQVRHHQIRTTHLHQHFSVKQEPSTLKLVTDAYCCFCPHPWEKQHYVWCLCSGALCAERGKITDIWWICWMCSISQTSKIFHSTKWWNNKKNVVFKQDVRRSSIILKCLMLHRYLYYYLKF